MSMRPPEKRRKTRSSSRTLASVESVSSRSLPERRTVKKKDEIIEILGLDRKKLLKALISIDKGEFRWSFLTPWVRDRELTRLDKIIICTTFVTLTVGLQHHPPQYVANFFSYTIGNQIGYRLIAIVASFLEIMAYDTDGGLLMEDAIPDGYNFIFIIVNLYYVLRWTLNRIDAVSGVLEPLEAELFERCFEPLGVGAYQYLKLLDLAEWVEVSSSRQALTVEGEQVKDLFVSVIGDFDVTTNGQRVASIPPFQIIGEVAMLENLQSKDGQFHQAARATVLAEPGSLFVRWPHSKLYALQKSDQAFARAISLAISRTLSHKLGSARRSAGALLASSSSLSQDEVITFNSDNIQTQDAVRVLPVVAPELERIYTSCFSRQGFDDGIEFINLVRLAKKSTTPPEGARIDMHKRMLALVSGSALVYEDGLKLQKLSAPRLIGVEPFLKRLLSSSISTTKRRKPTPSTNNDNTPPPQLVLELEPGAQLLSWNIQDLSPPVTKNANLRTALKALYLTTVQDDTRNAQTIIAQALDPTLPSISSVASSPFSDSDLDELQVTPALVFPSDDKNKADTDSR